MATVRATDRSWSTRSPWRTLSSTVPGRACVYRFRHGPRRPRATREFLAVARATLVTDGTTTRAMVLTGGSVRVRSRRRWRVSLVQIVRPYRLRRPCD